MADTPSKGYSGVSLGFCVLENWPLVFLQWIQATGSPLTAVLQVQRTESVHKVTTIPLRRQLKSHAN